MQTGAERVKESEGEKSAPVSPRRGKRTAVTQPLPRAFGSMPSVCTAVQLQGGVVPIASPRVRGRRPPGGRAEIERERWAGDYEPRGPPAANRGPPAGDHPTPSISPMLHGHALPRGQLQSFLRYFGR